MDMMVCAIYDRKTDSYGTGNLLMYHNDGTAKRAIHAVVLDESMEYSRYAADYSLWHVGEFNTYTGVCVGVERRKICEFDEFVVSKPVEG